MTFKEAMIKKLVDNGFFEDKATEVIEEYMKDESSESMNGRWNDDVNDYPQGVQTTLWLNVSFFTSGWIERNEPNSWLRMFFKAYTL